ncbi:MAG: Franean1_4349 family RiPP [Chloroflexi bacterium]|nr:Franean1_4349 family RiPP [Chloroflexota bacterium]
MSQAFEDIIERAGKDPAFRQLLLDDPQKALEGYAVTDDEREMLGKLDEAQIDKFAGGLGDRTTKGAFGRGFG